MATNWRRPLDEFEDVVPGLGRASRSRRHCSRRRSSSTSEPATVTCSPDELIRILLAGGSRGPFRAQMARAAVTFRPPIGLFGRLRDHAAPPLDVKRGGTAAIVLLARLYALVAGSAEHSTVLRLQAAAAAGTLSSATAGDLIDAYRFLTELRLRHQIQQADENVPADNRVLHRPVDHRATDDAARRAADGARHPGDHRSAVRNRHGDVMEVRR